VTGTKKWPDPQTDDPLAEPTPGRRLWSAYLRAGYTRSSFAAACKVSYQTIINLDTGKTTWPDLETLLRACALIKYTPDQIIYGHVPPSFIDARQALTPEEISVIWRDSGAAFEAMTALHELRHGPGGEYLLLTRAFVQTYVDAFARVFDRSDPASYERAKLHARIAATQGAALAEAVALDASPVGGAPRGGSKRKRKVSRTRVSKR
jgi:transcriptional regulator with XRE-family HTH domain